MAPVPPRERALNVSSQKRWFEQCRPVPARSSHPHHPQSQPSRLQSGSDHLAAHSSRQVTRIWTPSHYPRQPRSSPPRASSCHPPLPRPAPALRGAGRCWVKGRPRNEGRRVRGGDPTEPSCPPGWLDEPSHPAFPPCGRNSPAPAGPVPPPRRWPCDASMSPPPTKVHRGPSAPPRRRAMSPPGEVHRTPSRECASPGSPGLGEANLVTLQHAHRAHRLERMNASRREGVGLQNHPLLRRPGRSWATSVPRPGPIRGGRLTAAREVGPGPSGGPPTVEGYRMAPVAQPAGVGHGGWRGEGRSLPGVSCPWGHHDAISSGRSR